MNRIADKDVRTFAFVIDNRFAGDLKEGKRFCERLFSYDVEVERVFGSVRSDDRPVLDCVMEMFSNTPVSERKELMKNMNDHLVSAGKNPVLLSDELTPAQLDIQDEMLDKTFQERPRRIKIFGKICNSACDDWRVIGHFLLPYPKIQTISINNPDDVQKRLRMILEEWHRCTLPAEATWLYMQSLLMFLNHRQLVSQIVDEEVDTSQVKPSNLYNIFRHNCRSAENESQSQYSAEVSSIVPEKHSLIHSFVECLKLKNITSDKGNVLEEMAKEISDHLSWYRHLVGGNILEIIEHYKDTGYYQDDHLLLLLNGLANAFKVTIQILTKDKKMEFYHQNNLIYPGRTQRTTDVIVLFVADDGHAAPLNNVQAIVPTIPSVPSQVITVVSAKDDYCILEVPENHTHWTSITMQAVSKKQDCPMVVYDLDKVEKCECNGSVYIRLNGLDEKNNYKCFIECKNDDGNRHQYVSRDFSLNEISVEYHTPKEGYTLITHKEIGEPTDGVQESETVFRSDFRCFQSNSKMKEISASDWINQCETYLERNLLKNNKDYFDEWTIFPNIFMELSNNATKDVAECLRDSLASHQHESMEPYGGIVITHFDIQEHKKFLLTTKFKEEDRDFSNHILVFHQKMSAILNIRITESIHSKGITDEFAKCSKDAEDLSKVMQFLMKQKNLDISKVKIASFVAATNLQSHNLKATIFQGKQNLICDGCIPRVLTKDQLSDTGKMKKWLRNQLPQILEITEAENFNSRQIMKELVAQVCGFIANTSIEVARHSDDIHDQLIHLQANDEQIRVIVDPQKHKFINAAFGCGKTVVATLQSEFLARMAKEPTTIFYISFDPFSLIDYHIDKHFKSMKLRNVESGLVNLRITNVSEIAAEMGVERIPVVSEILTYVQEVENNTGRLCHICIDELNTSAMSEIEVISINGSLSTMKDNFVTIIFQPFQYEQYEIDSSKKKKNQILKTYESHLKMSHVWLEKNMRNSVKISELLEAAKDVINDNETRYYYGSEMVFTSAASVPKAQAQENKDPPAITYDSSGSSDDDGFSDENIAESNSDDVRTKGFSKKNKYLPVPMRSQEHDLKQMSKYDIKRGTEGLLIKYRFDQSTEVGHSHQGKIPELTYVPSAKKIEKILRKCCSGKYDDKQKNILKIATCLQNVKAGDTIICHDEEEFISIRHALEVADKDFLIYAHCLEGKNKIPSIDEKRQVSEAINERKRIVLTDSNGCRGFQLRKVVIPLSSTEQFHRHTILENAARATSDILFIVIDCSALSRFGSRKSKFRKVIEKWDSTGKIKIIKTSVSQNQMTQFLKRLPSAELLLQPTEARIFAGKPTFADLEHLVKNDASELQRILSTNPSIVKMRGGSRGQTLLMFASDRNDLSIVRMLVRHGSDVGERDDLGWTCLHYCAVSRFSDCLSFLLPFASPHLINCQNNQKRTALFMASWWGDIECVELLLKYKADPHIKDFDGWTASDEACRGRGSYKTKMRIREVLLQH